MENFAGWRASVPWEPLLNWLTKIEPDNDQPLTELQQDSNIYLNIGSGGMQPRQSINFSI